METPRLAVVYLVVAHTDHESSSVIKAFASEADAEAFAQACRDYPRSPSYPDDDDDVKWKAAERAIKKWRKNHPAGPDECWADGCTVEALTVTYPTATRPPEGR